RRDQEDRVASIGPFAQARIETGRVGVMLGARYDAVRFETIDRRDGIDQSGQRTLHSPSMMLGVTMSVADAMLFANVASAFQTPTTTELINAPPAPGEACCPVGFNTGLEPQRLISTEIGVRGSVAQRVRYEAALYTMNVRDGLVQFQVPEAEGRSFFRNAGRTRHRGVELAAATSLTPDIALSSAYTLTDVRFRDDGSPDTQFEDNRVPGITPHRIFAAATWSPGSARIIAELTHNSSQPADDANTSESPGYTLLDLRARTSLALRSFDVAPFVALNNAFDRKYFGSLSVNAAAGRYYEPAPGRNIVLGVSLRTGGWRQPE
ncbi:MAG: TonB-dependent receptor, partial [Gemmatimonadetes bacterium]|nr:TonB-dependent receptor [Gemmatimonadota bacterium]